MPTFVAIDGEAIDGRYVLLARDHGEHVIDMNGLSTMACLRFLLDIPRAKGRVLVCFGLNYDVNNWLADLPRHKLTQLWETNVCYWRDHRIEWLPGRWFSVKRARDGAYAQVCECWGFFQQAFVPALREWGIEPPPAIAAMKRRRGTFTANDRRRVTDYCVSECRHLVTLMDRLAASCAAAGLVPRKWIGAGSIAAATLAANVAPEHHAYDLDLTTEQVANDVILGAYYAGRIELFRQGEFGHVNTSDLRSAYPAAIQHLPSLCGARLVYRKRYDPAAQHAIWRVTWACPPSTLLAPFPVRQPDFSIHYPLAGAGCYHAVEVAAAIHAGYDIQVREGWVLKHPPGEPFSWVPSLYRKRAALKRAGDPAQRALKLGLNSCYGKLAQGYGYNSRPRWQSYFWAGEVTAWTRAQLLRRTQPRAAIMLSTDGIFTTHRPRGSSRDRLGSWEAGALTDFFAAQSGVYQGHDPAGNEVVRSRGFFARDIDYDQLRDGYQAEGPEFVYTYRSRRFIGMGAALHRKDLSLWRQWVDEPRSLALMPERKQLAPGGQLHPPAGPMESMPYQPKVNLLDGRALDYLDGMNQPLRERQ